MSPAKESSLLPAADASEKRFGTFSGVFTPSILTILGVVMYLRFGWVVGNAGLWGALAIVLISHLITVSTGLSVSSIATNRSVGAGGAYYIISRSLGAPVGAAVGIPLFLGQALSVSFYVVGFSESLGELVPSVSERWLGSGVCLLLTLLALKSAVFAIKIQYGVMALIGVSLVSFFAGGRAPAPEAQAVPASVAPFSEVFAVFFPAVTGIMAGVGMSGDLKDPRRSLPRGTMLAIFAGFVVYASFPFMLNGHATRSELIHDSRIVWQIARVPELIYLGVWGATLSSAVGSLLTAPRTLQAFAGDGLAPRVLSRGHGPFNEPRFGMLVTFALAEAGILLGDLNSIANLLTMFFLATYGLTNLACGLEKWAASPSFRPDFRVPAWVSLAGAFACFYVMSVIDLLSMAAALVLCGLIFAFVERRALGTTYGDARHGIWSALVRTGLQRLHRTGFHPQNWRPNLVIMGGEVEKRAHLLELGSSIVQDRGIVTYFFLLRGSVEENQARRAEFLKRMDDRIAAAFPHVFYRVEVADDIYRGIVNVAQSYGVGNFEANTVMLGWPNKPERAAAYVDALRDLVLLDRSLLLVRHRPEGFGAHRHIQIWWGGLRGNGGLMLLLAFLITADERFRKAHVTVVTVVEHDADRPRAERAMARLLGQARLPAQARVIVRAGEPIAALMNRESTDADLAIIGLRLPERGEPADPFFEHMDSLLANLPTTILVKSAQSFEGSPVLFDVASKPQESQGARR